ncbi:plastid-lipid-associated protein 6, chloroplastic isoform X2 [Morus notabilis]|uniref:plastid-lipid-associated protein 6, chloroplastic isoform X2 n=1 Tax=Morus notabilis TaxID=981085 RepID=UPI000CED46DA|nr:plastid-lipid-associated protein 6, chloroplastic isoform X2 [Morus notabilis]
MASHSSVSVSHSSITCLLPTKTHSASTPHPLHCPLRRRLLSLGNRTTTRRSFSSVRASQDDVVSVVDPPLENEKSPGFELVPYLKLKLLSAVSGVNRGLAANADDLRKADAAAKELEDVGGPVDLSSDLDKLQGRWKLIYSSAFSSRTLGGSRPGPPTGRLLPITLGQVFQRIDILSKDFDNIVELELGAPWPLPPLEVTATLAHKFELIDNSKSDWELITTTTIGAASASRWIEASI